MVLIEDIALKEAKNGKEFFKVKADGKTYNCFEDTNAFTKLKNKDFHNGDSVKLEWIENNGYKNLNDLSASTEEEKKADADKKASSDNYWKEKHELDKRRLQVETASKVWFLFKECASVAVEIKKCNMQMEDTEVRMEDILEDTKVLFGRCKDEALLSEQK